MWYVDGSSIRAHPAAAGASKASNKTGPKNLWTTPSVVHVGWGSKIHLVSCSNGVPLPVTVTAGQDHESKSFESVMATVHPKH